MQEEYIKDEQKNLKKEYLHAQEEVKRIQSVPLVIGQFLEAVDQNTGIVGSTTGKDTCERVKLFCVLGNFAGLFVFAYFIQKNLSGAPSECQTIGSQSGPTQSVKIRSGLGECSGSVVECLTRDRRATGSSLTSITALCP